MSDFDDLVEEAEHVPIVEWDFGWLDGRAVEERPTWRYFDRVAERATDVSTLLEVQAGVGSMIGRLPWLPRLAVATEGFPPSVATAAPRLRSTGVHLVVTAQTRQALPFVAGPSSSGSAVTRSKSGGERSPACSGPVGPTSRSTSDRTVSAH